MTNNSTNNNSSGPPSGSQDESSPYLDAARRGQTAQDLSTVPSLNDFTLSDEDGDLSEFDQDIEMEDLEERIPEEFPNLPQRTNPGPPKLFITEPILGSSTSNFEHNSRGEPSSSAVILGETVVKKNVGPINRQDSTDRKGKKRAADQHFDSDRENSDEDDNRPTSKYAHATDVTIEQEREMNKLRIIKWNKKMNKMLDAPFGKYSKEEIEYVGLKLDMLAKPLSAVNSSRDQAPVQAQPAANESNLKKALEKKKFSTPIDKIPKFNLKNSNESNKFFKATSSSSNTAVVAYETVQDYITAFEQTLASYNTDINIHWRQALETSFANSIDKSPRKWLPFELETNGDKYDCWKP